MLARLKDDLFVVVLGLFFPSTQMGYISWAKKMSLYPYQFSVNSVMSVTFPVFARLQEHPERLKRAIEKAMYFISLLIFPVLVFGALYLSVHLKSKSFLTFGTLFLMGYILKLTSEYFSDSLGWPLALVIAGLAMIAAGYLSLYLKRKYMTV